MAWLANIFGGSDPDEDPALRVARGMALLRSAAQSRDHRGVPSLTGALVGLGGAMGEYRQAQAKAAEIARLRAEEDEKKALAAARSAQLRQAVGARKQYPAEAIEALSDEALARLLVQDTDQEQAAARKDVASSLESRKKAEDEAAERARLMAAIEPFSPGAAGLYKDASLEELRSAARSFRSEIANDERDSLKPPKPEKPEKPEAPPDEEGEFMQVMDDFRRRLKASGEGKGEPVMDPNSPGRFLKDPMTGAPMMSGGSGDAAAAWREAVAAKADPRLRQRLYELNPEDPEVMDRFLGRAKPPAAASATSGQARTGAAAGLYVGNTDAGIEAIERIVGAPLPPDAREAVRKEIETLGLVAVLKKVRERMAGRSR